MTVLRLLLGLVAVGAIVGLGIETFRLAELAGRHEVAGREAMAARQQAEAAQQRAEARAGELAAADEQLRGELAAAREQVERLQLEVAQGTERLTAMAEQVRQATVVAEERLASSRAAALESLRPMPEGVRLCVAALLDCLRAEGYGSLRILRATSLDAAGLHGVEVLATAPDGLGVALFEAGTMRVELDRGAGRLELVFLDGARTAGGERTELPEAGWRVVFEPVTGRYFEAQLPQLVVASGVYPEDEAAARRRATDVDFATRLSWLDRLDRLLAGAGTADRIRVQRFVGIEDAWFLDALLVAADERGHVVYGAGGARLGVEVDRAAGVVSLLLHDGTLRRGEASSTIGDSGMRILLPDVTPAAAIDTMLGMVVYK